MQYLNMGYNDVLNIPTNERRFYLGLLVKKKSEEQEKMQEIRDAQVKTGRGERRTKISGQALKNKLKSGEIKV